MPPILFVSLPESSEREMFIGTQFSKHHSTENQLATRFRARDLSLSLPLNMSLSSELGTIKQLCLSLSLGLETVECCGMMFPNVRAYGLVLISEYVK